METVQGLQRSKIALLVDFDNVILGIDDPGFDVEIVVNALRARGVIVLGRAYGDWYRHNRHRRKLMEQGIDLIETPVFGPIIKNSADMHMALDAFELAFTQLHIDTFCIVSGDSDFLPLIKRLQSRDKNVIVIAGHKFTSELVRRNCNEYLAYENLLAASVGATEDVTSIEGAYQLLHRTISTLMERDIEVRSSTVKQMMVQLNPAFSERAFGCSQFKQFLDRAARAGHIKIGPREGTSGEFAVYLPGENGDDALTTAPISTTEIRPVETRQGDNRFNENRNRRRGERHFPARRDDVPTETAPQLPAETVETAVEAPVATIESPAEAPGVEAPSVEARGEFVDFGSTLGRVPLRRGRLRFSARTGTTAAPAAVETPVETAEASAPMVEDQTSDHSETTAPVAVEEVAVEVPPVAEETNIVEPEVAAEEVKPKKRTTRSRKKKPAAEAAAPDAASEPPVADSPAPAADAAPLEGNGEGAESEAATPARRPRSRSRSRAKTTTPEPATETVTGEPAAVAAPIEAAPAADVAPIEASAATADGSATISGEGATDAEAAKPRRVLRRRYNPRK